MKEEKVIISEIKDSLEQLGMPTEISTLFQIQSWLLSNYNILVNSFLKEPFVKPYEFLYCIQIVSELDDYGTVVSDLTFNTLEDSLVEGIKYSINYLIN